MLLVLAGAALTTYFLVDEESESALDAHFEDVLVPLVEQSLSEIEVYFEELVEFHESIVRTVAATFALSVGGGPRRAAVEQVIAWSSRGVERARNPNLAHLWSPIETNGTIDDAVLFKQEHGFPNFQVRPSGNRRIYVPIYDIFPLNVANRRALGFDTWTQPDYRAALSNATDSGATGMTEPLAFIERGRGIAVYTPVYRLSTANGSVHFGVPPSVQTRRELVVGFLGTLIEARGLFRRTLQQVLQRDEVVVCLFDKVPTAAPDPLLPNVTNLVGCWPHSPLNLLNGTLRIEDPRFQPDTRWTAVRTIDVLGRRWVALISGQNLEPTESVSSAVIVAIVVISVLMLVLLVGGVIYALALRRTIASAHAARKAAEDTARAKSAFLAHISHELRTPLNGVVGMVEVALAAPGVPQTTRDNLKVARDSATILLDVINDVLDFTKAETGNITIEPVAFDVEALLASVVRMHLQQARSKHIQLFSRLDRSVPTVVVSDPLRIRQILTNLLSNALKFTDVGWVYVSCDLVPPDSDSAAADPQFVPWSDSMESLQESVSDSSDNERVLSGEDSSPGTEIRLRLRVIDTGIGFSFEESQRMFDPFVQAEISTARLYGGTGLGLAISAQLAKLLRGQLLCSSAGPGRGSCFELRVPVVVGSRLDTSADAQSASARSSDSAHPPDTAGPPEQNGALQLPFAAHQHEPDRRILLVDDNQINLKVFSMMLRDLDAVSIETAENGQVAIDACVSASRERGWPPYSLVLIDMSMPVMNGEDATREIRRMEQESSANLSKRMPIVLVSAGQGTVDPSLFDGALWKPVRRQVLRDAVIAYTQPS